MKGGVLTYDFLEVVVTALLSTAKQTEDDTEALSAENSVTEIESSTILGK